MEPTKSDLILFTREYPFADSERSFLKEELKYLSQTFENVVIVPMNAPGEVLYELPENVVSTKDLSKALRTVSIRQKLRGLFSIDFIQEVFRLKFNTRKLKLALAKSIAGVITLDWLHSFLNKNQEKRFVVYSFWCNECALGAVKYKRKSPSVKVVSRCHNFDLYGNEENGFYVPYQKIIVKELNSIYPVSYDGAEFLNERFNMSVTPAIMGVPDSKSINSGSNDGVLRIVSCSYMVGRKRLHLIFDGLSHFCKAHTDLTVEWTHIGDGPERPVIENMIEMAPVNLNVILTGALSNADVHVFYKRSPVDLFVNSSAKEGTPVSIMEAISYGVPILATGFGGNKEVVERGAGFALPIDPEPSDFNTALEAFVNCDRKALRISSREVWKKYYNSDVNSAKFCEELLKS